MVIMPPDRTAIIEKNPQAFPIVHSFESRQDWRPQEPRRSKRLASSAAGTNVSRVVNMQNDGPF